MDNEIYAACGYLARITMDVMGDLFTGARQTMNWLATCARLISSQEQPVAWISPIGVPAVQPYRQKQPYTVVTLLQTVVLINNNANLPIHKMRQASAFPPNYVHSLDSSHMLLTGLEMDRRGPRFILDPCLRYRRNERVFKRMFCRFIRKAIVGRIKANVGTSISCIRIPRLARERGFGS